MRQIPTLEVVYIDHQFWQLLPKILYEPFLLYRFEGKPSNKWKYQRQEIKRDHDCH